ncbi:Rossmann-like and DUF2520 domain-containing protein [uncultured Hymenobacter sp.]|uniref:Rossmann-like and DUF2520 domain-containing protein n=1 Tax=uncultured Hymenobacter sp. TaxID=170016 RepID=UPI0035CC1B0A
MTAAPAHSLRIGLFGAGRVAAQLAPALVAAGHELAFISSRSTASAAELAARFPTPPPVLEVPTAELPAADLYLLAVPDAAVPAVLAGARWPTGAVVAYLAGALPLSVFEAAPLVHGGVLYPLQTFSSGRRVAWEAVPLFIEAADTKAENLLLALAGSLSAHVQRLGSPERLRLHVGAVFANNFTNHLLGIAHELLADAGLPFDLLAPLIHETVDKALSQAPFTVQTGPAVRHDAPTLAAHRAALAGQPAWQQLYETLTAGIQAQQVGLASQRPEPGANPALLPPVSTL